MKLTKMSEFAVLLLPAMAHGDHPMKANELSKRTGVPLTYTQIILRKLANDRVLVSERGRNGGYRLAERAPELCVMSIVELLEGESFATAPSRPKVVHVVNAALVRAIENGMTMTLRELIECYRQELVVTEQEATVNTRG